ncbi:hypothetical protein D3C71_1432170 [compost metagenome]
MTASTPAFASVAVAAAVATDALVVCNWLPVIASVLPAAITPSARYWILRLLLLLPTDTVLALEVTELAPSATEFPCVTVAPRPSAIVPLLLVLA